MADWSAGFLAGGLGGFLTDELAGFLVDGLFDFLIDELAGFLAGWLPFDCLMSTALGSDVFACWAMSEDKWTQCCNDCTVAEDCGVGLQTICEWADVEGGRADGRGKGGVGAEGHLVGGWFGSRWRWGCLEGWGCFIESHGSAPQSIDGDIFFKPLGAE